MKFVIAVAQANVRRTVARNASGYGTEMDRFNRTTFDPIETDAVRIEMQLQPGWSAGILEWKVD
jgi:hypothetical protein